MGGKAVAEVSRNRVTQPSGEPRHLCATDGRTVVKMVCE